MKRGCSKLKLPQSYATSTPRTLSCSQIALCPNRSNTSCPSPKVMSVTSSSLPGCGARLDEAFDGAVTDADCDGGAEDVSASCARGTICWAAVVSGRAAISAAPSATSRDARPQIKGG